VTPQQFETLLRVRRHRRDQVRAILGRVLAEGRTLEERARQMETERSDTLSALRSGTASGGVDIDRAASFRYHALRLSAELGGLALAAGENAERVRKVRGVLARADQGVKAVERLRERFEAVKRREAERRADRDATDRFSSARATAGVFDRDNG
jgi:flagellar export protein FliJ